MAGHSHAKNIMHRKGAQDAKKAKQFTKIVKEIIVAVKAGGGADPAFNPRLRSAIADAKACNLPKDRIENAIKKASDPASGDDLEEIIYEAYYSGGIALVIELATDSRNRTSSEMKSIMNKHGGMLAEPGSVLYGFDHIGIIEFHAPNLNSDEVFAAAIECGAQDYQHKDSIHVIECAMHDFNNVRKGLTAQFGEPDVARLIWKPKALITVEGEKAEGLLKLLDAIEDSDDVQYVYGNYSIPENS
jgi:YebC/PmpR family DNA-binding regulatory protein